ncbi:hypothetical protein ASSaV_gp16 [Abalone shriveling syndrome-associated virus]|uniref:hypothetical protein n=1 Tax=Abalone shriveling syndrome-associated virus TaxID=491893 RepID=UPI0001881BB3|nr:hypothetical protein ASSaV_gp16 [Abalone shriveling syndrome-associated virus]ACJ71988.1 unknown [Abalone shriveling syndrome-associated virus]
MALFAFAALASIAAAGFGACRNSRENSRRKVLLRNELVAQEELLNRERRLRAAGINAFQRRGSTAFDDLDDEFSLRGNSLNANTYSRRVANPGLTDSFADLSRGVVKAAEFLINRSKLGG